MKPRPMPGAREQLHYKAISSPRPRQQGLLPAPSPSGTPWSPHFRNPCLGTGKGSSLAERFLSIYIYKRR